MWYALFSDLQEPCGCVNEDCYCSPEIIDQDYDKLNGEEKTYLDKLFQIYHFIAKKHDISNWSTKTIGTFFFKTIMENPLLGFDEIDDTFKPQNENVSWPDIAMMYNLKDFRVLTKYGNKLSTPVRYRDPGSQTSERYSSFQSCIDDIFYNYQFDEVTTFRKEDKVEKAIQFSPCQNLEKFQNCSEYCAWHKNFVETIGEEEFLQAMSYASAQRKVYKEPMPIEKKMAGTVKDLKKGISLVSHNIRYQIEFFLTKPMLLVNMGYVEKKLICLLHSMKI